jgi:carbon-monoxide dehydrogenase large subunit
MTSTAPSFNVIGKHQPRVEGAGKVSGGAEYTADVDLPGMVWGKNVRSPHAHARVVSIDASRALASPGVLAVLTSKDFPNIHTGRNIKDVPLLADGVVRFIGDKVAVVAAEDRQTAEKAADLVDVTYEVLPAVFDPIEALAPGAPLLHADTRSYVGFPEEVTQDMRNVCGHGLWERGDVEQGFKDADRVFEHTFSTQLAHQGYIEPTASVVQITPPSGGRGERVQVWAANKVPYSLRKELARVLQLTPEDVVVNAVTIGGDFGGKSSVADLPTAYHLARKLGRPVKFVNSIQEDLTAASPKHPIITKLRTGVKNDGTIVAHEAKVWINRGAYTGLNTTGNGLLGGPQRAGNFYATPNQHIEAFAVYTNQVPCGFMRAPGSPQVLFAVESHMDDIARQLGMDPKAFRELNVPETAPTGAESIARQVMNAAGEAFGWSDAPKPERSGKLVGRGLAIADRNQGAGEGSSAITVNPDGTITALTAMPDNGTGGLTIVAAIVAESWGVPLERVRLVRGNTDSLPIDVESGGSRITNTAGTNALAASGEVQAQLAPLAAQALGVPEAHWASGYPGGWSGGDGKFITLEDLATELVKEGEPAAHAQVTLAAPRTPDPGVCAQMAEVEVDEETGQITLLRIVTAQDVGAIINETGHQGQINGCVIQAMGHALMEELVLDEGRITTPNYNDYRMPTIEDMPELTTVNVYIPGEGPFGAKSIGELPHIPTAGAIANAVADAVGAPVLKLPITAERVLAMLRAT